MNKSVRILSRVYPDISKSAPDIQEEKFPQPLKNVSVFDYRQFANVKPVFSRSKMNHISTKASL